MILLARQGRPPAPNWKQINVFFGARITTRLLVRLLSTVVSRFLSVGGYTVDDAVEQLEAVYIKVLFMTLYNSYERSSTVISAPKISTASNLLHFCLRVAAMISPPWPAVTPCINIPVFGRVTSRNIPSHEASSPVSEMTYRRPAGTSPKMGVAIVNGLHPLSSPTPL